MIVRNVLQGKRPVLIGKRLPISYIYGPPNVQTKEACYLEADLHVGTSSKPAAQRIVGICKRYMKSLVVDLGLVIEGTKKDELPERMLGCVRLHQLDPEQCPTLTPDWEVEVER